MKKDFSRSNCSSVTVSEQSKLHSSSEIASLRFVTDAVYFPRRNAEFVLLDELWAERTDDPVEEPMSITVVTSEQESSILLTSSAPSLLAPPKYLIGGGAEVLLLRRMLLGFGFSVFFRACSSLAGLLALDLHRPLLLARLAARLELAASKGRGSRVLARLVISG